MRHRFLTCDVFTSERFRGNPLAVLPDARGLSDERMQQVAREFNYSETTFVLPARDGHDRRVRIFTPTTEVPFAGHPNIGTAFVLASIGELGALDAPRTVRFEEKAGVVPVTVESLADGGIRCELAAPQPLALGPSVDPSAVAPSVLLEPADIVASPHGPRVASVGLPFLMVELRSRDALKRARVDLDALRWLVEGSGETTTSLPPDVHLYVRSGDDGDAFDVRARMFAPLDGVPEDPATGSANCALAGLLAHREASLDGAFAWRIAQGVEMGRPSVLEARAEKEDGSVSGTWIGGRCALVADGEIEVG